MRAQLITVIFVAIHGVDHREGEYDNYDDLKREPGVTDFSLPDPRSALSGDLSVGFPRRRGPSPKLIQVRFFEAVSTRLAIRDEVATAIGIDAR